MKVNYEDSMFWGEDYLVRVGKQNTWGPMKPINIDPNLFYYGWYNKSFRLFSSRVIGS